MRQPSSNDTVVLGIVGVLVALAPWADAVATPISFVAFDFIEYKFTRSSGAPETWGSNNLAQFDQLERNPGDFGAGGSIPGWGRLGHSHTADTLTLRSETTLDVFDDNFSGFVKVEARFVVDGDPALLFDVFETDNLSGTLSTPIDLAVSNSISEADVFMTTAITPLRSYLQKTTNAADQSVAATTRKLGGVGQGAPIPGEWAWVANSTVSTVTFENEALLTQVRGGVPFTVTGLLSTSGVVEFSSEANSLFFDSLVIGLRANAVPEPSTIVMLGGGLLVVGMRPRRRV